MARKAKSGASACPSGALADERTRRLPESSDDPRTGRDPDPHDRQAASLPPANPPRPHLGLLGATSLVYVLWLGFLLYIAMST